MKFITKLEKDTYWAYILDSNFKQKFLLGKMSNYHISVKIHLGRNIWIDTDLQTKLSEFYLDENDYLWYYCNVLT